jgi:hypothetical protein
LPGYIRRFCTPRGCRRARAKASYGNTDTVPSWIWRGHLDRNGTRIIKFFLHLSKEEQRKRFLERIDKPEKNWKFSSADFEERKFWKRYMRAYEKALAATSTRHAPWYVVPADDKLNSRLIVSRILLDTIESLELSYPKTTAARRRELLMLRKKLTK